jgi:uncharacterized protein DUF4124
MRAKIWLPALIVSCALFGIDAVHADKLYKWTDSEGNVHYTDHPPPSEAKTQEQKRFGDKPNDVALPYSLQKAMKDFPATLYTTDCGDGCSKAAALLSQRGVPFSQKNPREAAAGEELKALTGGKLEVPVLKLGSQVLRGFEEGGWNQALDAAGYPRTALVPPKVATKSTAAKPAAKPEPGKNEKAVEPPRTPAQ